MQANTGNQNRGHWDQGDHNAGWTKLYGNDCPLILAE